MDGGSPPAIEVGQPVGFQDFAPWWRRLWHLLWIVPLLWIGFALASPPERLGPPPQILAFDVEPAAARPGAAVTLNWSVEGAEEVRIDPLPGRDVPAVGRQTVPAPATSTSFRLTATAEGQTRSATIQLTVAQAPPEVLLFEAQPKAIEIGEASLLTWNVSGDDVVVTIEPGDGSRLGANGSVILHPTESTVYTLFARNTVGEAAARAEVQVGARPLPGPPQVRQFEIVGETGGGTSPGGGEGRLIVLGWSVTNADRISISGDGKSFNDLRADGSIEVDKPVWTTDYYLTAAGAGGTTVAELTVVGSAGGVAVPPPPIVVEPVLSGDPGIAAAPPDAGNNGNLVDGVVAGTGTDAFAQFAPVVETFDVTPSHPRLGDEVVVRWAVAGADRVVVRLDPAQPGDAPLAAEAGVYRFVATHDVNIVLEATNVAGVTVRRQVAFDVRTFAETAVGLDLDDGPPRLLVGGERGTGTALVGERGAVWLFRDGAWHWVGSLPAAASPAVSAAFVGQTLFVVGADGRIRTLAVDDLAVPTRQRDPWRPTLALGAVELGAHCTRANAVAGFSVIDPFSSADRGGSLVVACAEPAAILAFNILQGGQLDSINGGFRWRHDLKRPPASMVGTPRPGTGDGVVAVTYAAAGALSGRVHLFAASTGWIGAVTAPGPVAAVAASPDGTVVAAATIYDPAIHVLDRRGLAARRIPMPAQVDSLSWQAALDAGAAAAETPQLVSTGAGQPMLVAATPPPIAEVGAPPPAPRSVDPNAAISDGSPGWLLVVWRDRSGGALVNLAPWSTDSTVVDLFTNRSLVALVDDGEALVGATAGPDRASALSWLAPGAPDGGNEVGP